MSTIVCYYDKILNEHGYMEVLEDPFVLEDFQKTYPNLQVDYAFYESSNILSYELRIAEDWYAYEYEHGLPLTVINKTIKTPTDSDFVILGYKPHNRKYKVICRDKTSNKRFKATIEWIAEQIEYTVRLNYLANPDEI